MPPASEGDPLAGRGQGGREGPKEVEPVVDAPLDDEALEVAPARVPPGGRQPSRQEIEHHVATGHAVHRAWCRACMTARGQAVWRGRQDDAQEGADPVVCLDYGFMMPGEFEDGEHLEEAELEDDEEDVKLPMIVAKGCKTVTYSAVAFQKKGSSEQARRASGSSASERFGLQTLDPSVGWRAQHLRSEGGGHGKARWRGCGPLRVPGRRSSS